MNNQLAQIYALMSRTNSSEYSWSSFTELLNIVESEIRQRLAFEQAMKQYLLSSPSSPFMAAQEFLEWLDADIEGEQSAG